MSKTNFKVQELGNNKFRITLEVPLADKWYDDVYFVCFNQKDTFTYKVGYKNKDDKTIYFETEVEIPDSALYQCYVRCTVDGKNKFLNKNNEFTDGLDRSDFRKLSVNFNVPDWCKGKMIYHIFVDRFNKGREEELPEMPRRVIHKSLDEDVILGADSKYGLWNIDFYGGDLKGIIDKLDYIKTLGCTILYLSPIVRSQSNHRYDTGDYLEIDPYAGSMEDLKLLCDEAHKMGMKVILDGVFNHTGNDSKYFNELGSYDSKGAFNNSDSEYSSYYARREVDGKTYYNYWWGFKNLPECNPHSVEWQNFICGKGGVIDKWFECGIDGLRLDVADELTDYYIELIREACHRNKKDSFIYGEVWENPMRMGRSYIASGKGMDSVMNYQWMDSMIRYYNYGDVHKLREKIDDVLLEYPDATLHSLMNSTSTHDFSRLITILGKPELFNYYSKWGWDLVKDDLDFIRNFKLTPEEYERGKNKLLSYLVALGNMPGNFTIFYGDEIGMEGLGNLQNRRYMDWNRVKDQNEILQVVRNIGKIKKENPFLSDADFRLLDMDERFMLYERYKNQNGILVGVSRSDDGVNIRIPRAYDNGEKVLTLKKSNSRTLNPYGAIIIKK